jgi:hypothetical protein
VPLAGREGCLGFGHAIAVDAAGNAYIAGYTSSANFPVTLGALQTSNNAAPKLSTNVFVTKLNPTGAALIYSTYLGGSPPASLGPYVGDSGNVIAVDAAGGAYVAGLATSTDFPVTQGAFQTTNRNTLNTTNAFVTKLNATGTALVYSTYLGGSGGIVNVSPTLLVNGGDQVDGLAIAQSANVYVTGFAASSDFPVTENTYQAINNDQPGCVGGYYYRHDGYCATGRNHRENIHHHHNTGRRLHWQCVADGCSNVRPERGTGLAHLHLRLDQSGDDYRSNCRYCHAHHFHQGRNECLFRTSRMAGSPLVRWWHGLDFRPAFRHSGAAPQLAEEAWSACFPRDPHWRLPRVW